MQHCKQHINFNKRLHELGYGFLKPIEKEYEAGYKRFLDKKSLRFNLAYCEGFESLSATACELYFEDYNELLENADPEPTNMWRWHRSEEHTSELQSLMRISYAGFCLQKQNNKIMLNNQ